MSAGADWTGERVMARLIDAFRTGRDPDVVDLILLSSRCLGRESFPRVQLLTFARAYAAGERISEVCRVHSWPRTAAYRRVRRAAAEVAACLDQWTVRF